MENGMMVCAICGAPACARVKRRKNDDDGEEDDMILYYCKNCLRGHKEDESFFE